MSARQLLPSALALVAYVLASSPAFALPLGDGRFNALSPRAGAPDPEAGGVDFTSIVALSNCSGALVRFTSSLPTDRAMILTNGHCYEGGFLDPGEVIVNRASTRTFRLLNADASATLATLRAVKILYATMTDTDVTLYQLTTTYADISSRYEVEALVMASERPSAGEPIAVVSGYWRRIYSCAVDDMVYSLHEDGWIFRDSIRYTQPGCATIGGTSGSPIVATRTREVIGINNTVNEDGERCTFNNPCEVAADGEVTVRAHASYGQQTYQVYTCVESDNSIDLRKDGCLLPKPRTLRPAVLQPVERLNDPWN